MTDTTDKTSNILPIKRGPSLPREHRERPKLREADAGVQDALADGRAPTVEELFEELKVVAGLTIKQLRAMGEPSRVATALGHLAKVANSIMAAEQLRAVTGEFTADMTQEDMKRRAAELIESLKQSA